MEARIGILKNKRGVSAVIGVILVVAITVLLAALAYTYLTSMATPTQNIHKVAVEVQRSGPVVYATVTGGQDVGKITNITLMVPANYYVSNANIGNYSTVLNSSTLSLLPTSSYNIIKNNTGYYITINGNTYNLTNYLQNIIHPWYSVKPSVGTTIWVVAGDVNHPVHVKVVATFADGTSAVLYEGTV